MAEEIAFTHGAWGPIHRVDPAQGNPAWVRAAGFGKPYVDWYGRYDPQHWESAPLQDIWYGPCDPQHWETAPSDILARRPPEVGRLYTLGVGGPFHARLGEAIWVLWSAYDDLLECPPGLASVHVVRVAPRLVLQRGEFSAKLAAEVIETIALSDLADHFPPVGYYDGEDLGEFTRGEATVAATSFGSLHFLDWGVEGDIGGWEVWQERGDGGALVLAGDWGFDSSTFQAGHFALGPNNVRALLEFEAHPPLSGWEKYQAALDAPPARGDEEDPPTEERSCPEETPRPSS